MEPDLESGTSSIGGPRNSTRPVVSSSDPVNISPPTPLNFESRGPENTKSGEVLDDPNTQSNDRRSLVREALVDDALGIRSIEVHTPRNESRAECIARLDEYVQTLNETRSINPYIDDVPTWFTAEFLYRINYGPVTSSDCNRVLRYSDDQTYAMEASQRRRAYPYRKTVRLPFRREPIRNTVKVENWNKPFIDRHDCYLSFLDPELSRILFPSIFPGCGLDSIQRHFMYHGDLISSSYLERIVVFEHKLLKEMKRRRALLPLAALVADVHTLRSIISNHVGDPFTIDWTQIQRSNPRMFYFDLFQTPPDASLPEYDRNDSSFLRWTLCCTLLLVDIGNETPGPPFRNLSGISAYKDDPSEMWFHLGGFSKQNEESRNRLRLRLDRLKLNLSDIDASFICSGPFRLMLTTRLEKHLVLDKDGYLQVFWDFRKIPGETLEHFGRHFFWGRTTDGHRRNKYAPRSSVSEHSKYEEFAQEILLSHMLLFERSSVSKRLGERFYGTHPDMWASLWHKLGVKKLKVDYVPTDEVLERFMYLGPRLVHLLEKMENWSPREFHELFMKGYVDRTTWWIGMFGIFFGVVSILILGFNLALVVLTVQLLPSCNSG